MSIYRRSSLMLYFLLTCILLTFLSICVNSFYFTVLDSKISAIGNLTVECNKNIRGAEMMHNINTSLHDAEIIRIKRAGSNGCYWTNISIKARGIAYAIICHHDGEEIPIEIAINEDRHR